MLIHKYMWLEEFLTNSEKKKISSLTKSQEEIISRREAIKRIINWKRTINNRSNVSKWEWKIRKNNADAFQEFLTNEWFFEKKNIDIESKTVKDNKIDRETLIKIKWYYRIISSIHSYTRTLSSELKNWLSHIKKIDLIINDVKNHLSSIVKYREENILVDEYNSRLISLIWYLNSLIKVLNDSKEDIIDYYSNKTSIINLLNSIINNTNWLLKLFQKRNK